MMRSGNTFKAFSFTDERHIGTTWRALSKEIGDLIKQCSIAGKPVASSRTEAVSCGLRWQINRRLTSSLTEGRYRRNRDEKNWVAIRRLIGAYIPLAPQITAIRHVVQAHSQPSPGRSVSDPWCFRRRAIPGSR